MKISHSNMTNPICWRPFVAPNPNIPFEFYLELIAQPPLTSRCLPCPASQILRPKPIMMFPYNTLMESIHFNPNHVPMSSRQSFITETFREDGAREKSVVTPESISPKIHKHGKSANVKKYKCKQCGRGFSRSNTLVTHERIHTGEKPFECDLCHRKFRQHGNLTRHKVIHTNMKPFSCFVCKRAFNRKSNLKTHIKTHRSPGL